jgi:hypothetical protein
MQESNRMQILNPVSIDFWQDVVGKCPWATYFHTPRWASVMAKTFPEYSVAGHGCILDSGTRVVIPGLVREKKGLIRKTKQYKSMEPGVYGGIIADRDPDQDEVGQIVSQLLRIKKTSGRIIESPFKHFDLSAWFKAKEMTTHIVGLEADFDSLRKKFNRGQKSNINQAQKKNVSVRRAETEDDIEQYYRIYCQTVKRWGEKTTRIYPRRLFQNLFQQKDPQAVFWLAEVDSLVIAGIIVLSWCKNLIYWHGCALQEYFKYYPNNLLHAFVMQEGCKNGAAHYDMGASMGLTGVIKFKESFGAKPHHYKAYRWK